MTGNSNGNPVAWPVDHEVAISKANYVVLVITPTFISRVSMKMLICDQSATKASIVSYVGDLLIQFFAPATFMAQFFIVFS